jgi:hypothetical protein
LIKALLLSPTAFLASTHTLLLHTPYFYTHLEITCFRMSATPEHVPLIGGGGEIMPSAPKDLDPASAVKAAVHNLRVASQAAKAPERPAQVGMVEDKVAVDTEDADKAAAKAAADDAIATQLKGKLNSHSTAIGLC